MQDLRGFLQGVEALGELRTVRQADWNLEIGTICEMNSERNGPALFRKLRRMALRRSRPER